jgi:hypothetical protein
MQNKFIINCYQKKYGSFLVRVAWYVVRGTKYIVKSFMISDLLLKQIFTIFVQFLERWQSGRMRRSRKPLSANRWTGGSNPPLSATPYISIPASVAEIYEAIVPQIIALNPSLARSAFLLGTITPIPPS